MAKQNMAKTISEDEFLKKELKGRGIEDVRYIGRAFLTRCCGQRAIKLKEIGTYGTPKGLTKKRELPGYLLYCKVCGNLGPNTKLYTEYLIRAGDTG